MKDKPGTSNEDFEAQGGFDLNAFYHIILERWWLVLLCFVFTMGLGTLYVLVTPKTYKSESVVEVEQGPSKVLNIQDVTSEDLKQDEILKTIESRLTSVDDLSNVIDRLSLTPAMLGLTRKDPPYSKEELIVALNDAVTAKLQRGTRLITVSATNTDRKLAQAICAELVAEYIRSDAAERIGISGEANKFLLEQSDQLKQRVTIAEKAAQDFKDAHPGVSLDDSTDFTEGKLRDLVNRVNDARATRIRLEADNDQVQRIFRETKGADQTDQLLTVQSVATDPGVLQVQKSISDEEGVFASLKQRYLPKHPSYIQEQSKLGGLQSALQDAVYKVAKSLNTAVDAARQGESKMEHVLAVQEQAKADNDKLSIPYSALTREVGRNRDLYDSVQERLKETDLTTNMDDNKIQTVSAASMPYKPYKPMIVLVLTACFAGGALLSGALCYALSIADDTLRTIDAAEEALGMQAVGAIPMAEKLLPLDEGVAILQEPDGAVAEAFRTLRAALGLLDGESTHRVCLFTSGVPGEGKSYCSINYAISLAQLGRRTLLMDFDLRLPSVEPIFFKEKKTNGVSLLIEGVSSIEECYYPTLVPNLFVMPAGKRSQSPSELIANTDFPKLFAMISTHFDEVVVDSSPVHAVSDTLLIAKHVDVVVQVVHAAKTPAKVARRAAEKLESSGAKPAGFVLNRLPKTSADYYYYYGGGSYGKGVYGASAAAKG